jgi:ATP-dependent Clp protease ATP-binding subunit ClpA
MTSNLGAEHRPVGLQLRLEGSTSRALQSFFRPEFLNRVDHVVHFQPLDARRVAQIARKELKELEQRPGLKSRGLRLNPQEALLQLLVDEGFDARFGARPLQRAVERRVITALSQLLNAQPQLREVELELDWDGRQVLVYPV